ncbi:MAG TPA: hypothetical protein V6C89_03145 [Drouetiella sp.]|jgi:hypothetical protein
MTIDSNNTHHGEKFAAADSVTATEQAITRAGSLSDGLKSFTEQFWDAQDKLNAGQIATYKELLSGSSMLPPLAIEWGKENQKILDLNGDGQITRGELSSTVEKLERNGTGVADQMMAETLLKEFDQIRGAGKDASGVFASTPDGTTGADLQALSVWDLRTTGSGGNRSEDLSASPEQHASLLDRLQNPFDAVMRADGKGYDMPILEEWYHNVMNTDWEKDR